MSRVDLPEDAPLVAVGRGGLVESVHHGRVAVCTPEGEVLEAVGDADALIYLRSAAKPFQALPMMLHGAADTFGFTDEELAVICASHSGQRRHVGAVRSVLRKAGLRTKHLQNGAHPPLDERAAARLVRKGREPRAIHGNCSGKHAGMLALCVHQGWDLEGYRDPAHPAQREILAAISQLCGVEQDDIPVAGDNCGVPTFALPLRGLATGFARLATGKGLDEGPGGELVSATLRIRDAMRDNPYMVAGTGRFDKRLMRNTDLVAKGGAEAVFACGSPEGWGLAIKISDGFSRAVRRAAAAALVRRGVNVPRKLRSVRITDLHGEPVGKFTPLL